MRERRLDSYRCLSAVPGKTDLRKQFTVAFGTVKIHFSYFHRLAWATCFLNSNRSKASTFKIYGLPVTKFKCVVSSYTEGVLGSRVKSNSVSLLKMATCPLGVQKRQWRSSPRTAVLDAWMGHAPRHRELEAGVCYEKCPEAKAVSGQWGSSLLQLGSLRSCFLLSTLLSYVKTKVIFLFLCSFRVLVAQSCLAFVAPLDCSS